MKSPDPLDSLTHYDKACGEPLGLSMLEFVIAGLPTALYLGQLFTAEEAAMFGAKCLILFGITALIRHGCRWSLRSTGLACVLTFIPVVIWVYQLAMGTQPSVGNPSEDF